MPTRAGASGAGAEVALELFQATFLFEAAVSRVHVHDDIRAPGTTNRIDPDRWRPVIMAFQRFYGLSDELRPSKLATIDEEWYR